METSSSKGQLLKTTESPVLSFTETNKLAQRHAVRSNFRTNILPSGRVSCTVGRTDLH